MAINFAAHTLRAVLRTFGKPVAYTPPGGEPVGVTGRFRRKPVAVSVDGQVEVVDTAPTVLVALAGAPVAPAIPFPDGLEPAEGGAFTIGGKAYEVEQVQPDDASGALCMLREL